MKIKATIPFVLATWASLGQRSTALDGNALGVIDCASSLDDGGFNAMLESGLQQASQEKGFSYTVPNCVPVNELESFLQNGTKYVFFNGFQAVASYAEEANRLVATYPDVKYIAIDSVPSELTQNWLAVTFNEEVGAYAVGYLAGEIAKSRNKVVAGVFGVPFPPVKRFRNGFIRGVNDACKDCVTHSEYLHSFGDLAGGSRAAEYYVDTLKADVVFAAAGGTGQGVLFSATERGAFAIGVDTDQHETLVFPTPAQKEKVVSSAVKRIDTAVRQVISELDAGTFAGGTVKPINALELAPCYEACAQVEEEYLSARRALDDARATPSITKVQTSTGMMSLNAFYGESHPSDSWSVLNVFGPAPIATSSAASTYINSYGDDILFTFGGRNSDFFDGSPQLWSLNVGSTSWQMHYALSSGDGTTAPGGRYGAAMASLDETKIVLFGGGFGNQDRGDTWILNLPDSTNSAGAWTQVTPGSSPRARSSHAMAGAGGKVFVFGGTTSSSDILDDLWSFDGASWSQLCASCSPKPSPRLKHTLTSSPDGKFLFLFGGEDNKRQVLDDFWQFDVAKQQWTRLPASGVPRAGHQAILVSVIPPENPSEDREFKTALAVFGGEVPDSIPTNLQKAVSYFFFEEENGSRKWQQAESYVVRTENDACSTDGQTIEKINANTVDFRPRASFVAFPAPSAVETEGNKIITFGGSNADSGGKISSVEAFHPAVEPFQRNLNQLELAMKIGISTLFVISGLLCISLIVWSWINRNHTVLRSAQFPFLFTVGVGVFISSASIVPIVIDDIGDDSGLAYDGEYLPANVACMSTVWLFTTGFICSFAPLFAKMWRVHKIFSDTKLRKIKISNRQLFGACAMLLAVEWSLVLAWQVTSPLVFVRTIESSNKQLEESVGYCTSPNSAPFLFAILAFHLVILFYGNYLSYSARKIDVRFQESRGIAITLVANLQVLALSIPVLVIVADNPLARSTILAGVIFLNNVSILGFIFIPKILMVRSGKYDVNTSTSDMQNSSFVNRSEGHSKTEDDSSMFAGSFHTEFFHPAEVKPPRSRPPAAPKSQTRSFETDDLDV